MPDNLAETVEAVRRARSTVTSTWSSIAQSYTLGWGMPAEAVAGTYPFISDDVWRLRRTLTRELPLLIYLSRESPPTQAAVAIPYRDDTGNPYNCRLAALQVPNGDTADLLPRFSQAIWFLMGNGLLPLPQHGEALMRALLAMTGRTLFEL